MYCSPGHTKHQGDSSRTTNGVPGSECCNVVNKLNSPRGGLMSIVVSAITVCSSCVHMPCLQYSFHFFPLALLCRCRRIMLNFSTLLTSTRDLILFLLLGYLLGRVGFVFVVLSYICSSLLLACPLLNLVPGGHKILSPLHHPRVCTK